MTTAHPAQPSYSTTPKPGAAGAPTVIPCHDPATGESLGTAPVVGVDEVRERIARGRRAQARWAKSSFEERRRVLARILDHLLDHTDELCELIVRDAGKTLENALLGEIWPVCEKLRHTIATGERDLSPEPVSPGLLVHKRAQIEFHPLGVVGVICPWNFPLQNVLGPTVPALMAGNAVVAKVSEHTAYSAPRIQAIFDEAFDRTGHDRDLVQVITGYAETGAAVISQGSDLIIFTGSMENGRRVLAEAARTLTPVILELGGKDPMIVCDDADVDQAVAAALAGTFIASGQMCLAAERIYVHEAIHDRFVERVVQKTSALRQGASLVRGRAPAERRADELVDIGAMTMPGQLDIVEGLVRDAVDKGAHLRVGGRKQSALGGQFFAPTVLTHVDHRMAVMKKESFGPIMSIMKVSSDEEAVALANDSDYGLGSTVFSRNGARAAKIASQLRAGSTVVNDFGLAYMANELPFGGVRGSGFGRLNGKEGIRACTNRKAVMTDRFPLHQPVELYPVKPGDYARTRATIELLYRRGVLGKAGAALGMLKTLGEDLWRRFRG